MRIAYINELRVIATLCVVLIHSIIIDENTLLHSEIATLMFYKNVLWCVVPLFVMISGALFLNPSKETSYKAMGKYVRRIFLALVVFGLPMCFMELLYGGEKVSAVLIFDTLTNWVTGHSWGHMWYLYMLLGLYLVTPIIKPFVVEASDTELKISLGLLFVLSVLFPLIERMGVDLEGYMIITTPYIFIYVLGYYLCWRASAQWTRNKWLLAAIIVACVVVLFERIHHNMMLYGSVDLVIIIQAIAIFLLFKSINKRSKVADILTPYCFGVYLLQAVFANVAYKVLAIDKAIGVPFYNWIGLGTLFFLFSLAGSFLLSKFPPLRKYVL